MAHELTKDDLRDLRDTLTDAMRDGFQGVHDRQDVTNGRVQKAEVVAGVLGAKLENLEREVFNRRQSDRRTVVTPTPEPEKPKGISDRDVRIVVATLLAVGGTVTFIKTVWPALAALVKAGP